MQGEVEPRVLMYVWNDWVCARACAYACVWVRTWVRVFTCGCDDVAVQVLPMAEW